MGTGRARKSGAAHAAHLPLDTEIAETRYEADAALTLTPDRLYDRHWAMTLLDRALTRLRTEQERAGKAREFAVLSPFLTARTRGAFLTPMRGPTRRERSCRASGGAPACASASGRCSARRSPKRSPRRRRWTRKSVIYWLP